MNNSEDENATLTVYVFYDPLKASSIYITVTLWLWKTYPIVLLCFGSIGNVMTIAVLLRQNLRSCASTMYLLALAVTDLMVLYFGLLRQYLIKTNKRDIRNDMGCGFHMWLVYTSIGYSSWILVALTMERVISIKFPVFVRNRTSSRKSAMIVLLILFAVIASLNSHLIFNWTVVKYSGIAVSTNSSAYVELCTPSTDTSDYYEDIWPWLDLCVVSVIPFLLLAVGNCFTGHNLIIRARSKRKRTSEGSVQSGQSHNNRSPTKLLVLLSVVFFISTLPASIYLVVVSFYQDIDRETSQHFALWWAITSAFMYTNNAINFILYCVSGRNFRRELKSMVHEIWCWCHKTVSRICFKQNKNKKLIRFAESWRAKAKRHNQVGNADGLKESHPKMASNRNETTDEHFRKGEDIFLADRLNDSKLVLPPVITETELHTVDEHGNSVHQPGKIDNSPLGTQG